MIDPLIFCIGVSSISGGITAYGVTQKLYLISTWKRR